MDAMRAESARYISSATPPPSEKPTTCARSIASESSSCSVIAAWARIE